MMTRASRRESAVGGARGRGSSAAVDISGRQNVALITPIESATIDIRAWPTRWFINCLHERLFSGGIVASPISSWHAELLDAIKWKTISGLVPETASGKL